MAWDYYIGNVSELGELTPLEKEQAQEAFRFLRKTLGQDFLVRIAARAPQRRGHPLFGLLLNFAPWTRKEIVRFAESLRTLQGSTNLDQLINKLDDPQLYAHQELTIKAAARLASPEMKVTFEPSIPIAQGQKQPDAKLENIQTNEVLFLEIAIQGVARGEQETFQAMNEITFRIMGIGVGLRWAGRIYKTPATPHLKDILDKMERSIKRASDEKTLVTLVEEESYEFAFCPEEKLSLLQEWCEVHGLSPGGFEGPLVDTNDVERLKRKIEKEQAQLPKGQPNAILIQDSAIFFRTRNFRRLISELEEEIYKYSHVPLLVVHGVHLVSCPTNS